MLRSAASQLVTALLHTERLASCSLASSSAAGHLRSLPTRLQEWSGLQRTRHASTATQALEEEGFAIDDTAVAVSGPHSCWEGFASRDHDHQRVSAVAEAQGAPEGARTTRGAAD